MQTNIIFEIRFSQNNMHKPDGAFKCQFDAKFIENANYRHIGKPSKVQAEEINLSIQSVAVQVRSENYEICFKKITQKGYKTVA